MPNVTMKKIAQKAIISYTTVSMVLNEKPINVKDETRERIMQIARELNYLPNHFAQSMKTGKTGILGVSISGVPDEGMFRHPYMNELYRGINTVANDSQYRLVFHNFTSGTEFKKTMDIAASKLVDGLILIYPSINQSYLEEELERIQKLSVPFVVVHSNPEGIGVPSIGFKSGMVGEIAAQHLQSLGYSDIACVVPSLDTPLYRDIVQGFRETVPETETIKVYDGTGNKTKGGREFISEWLDKGESLPQAFFVADDAVASGMILCLLKAGIRIPEDVAFVGFGDLSNPDTTAIELTTVRHPAAEKGERAAKVLLKRLGEPGSVPENHTELVEPTLIIRESCGSKSS
jgi:LacI family transcriptional regulator